MLAIGDRKYLRGLGHQLKPTLHVGKEGFSRLVVDQLDRLLEDHELVKVKVLDSAPVDRKKDASVLADKASGELVQKIGRTWLIYRRHPDEPVIVLPSERG